MTEFNVAAHLPIPQNIGDIRFQEGALYATKAILRGIYILALGRAPSDYPRWADWELELYSQIDKVIYQEIEKIENLRGIDDRI